MKDPRAASEPVEGCTLQSRGLLQRVWPGRERGVVSVLLRGRAPKPLDSDHSILRAHKSPSAGREDADSGVQCLPPLLLQRGHLIS